MNLSLGSITAFLLKSSAWLFFGAAGLAFLFGGGLIHALVGTERITAEAEGIVLAALCAGIGVIARIIEYRIKEGELPASLGEALSKR